MSFGAGSAASSFGGLPGSADQLLDGMIAAAGSRGFPGAGGLGDGAASMNPLGVGGFGFAHTGGTMPTLPVAPAWPSSLTLGVASSAGVTDGTGGSGADLSFAAPGGPSAPQVRLASRGGGTAPQQTTAVPTTVGAAFAEQGDVEGLSEFFAQLGVKERTSMRAFCCVAEADMEAALAAASVVGFALTPIQRGELVAAIRGAFVAQGMAQPGLGSPLPATASPAPVAPQHQITPQPQTDSSIPDALAVPLADVVDQSSRGHARMLTFVELALCRNRYISAAGCPPPEELTPTAEQLAALQSLLASGRVPFVGFAVWCPFGSRLARFRKTDAQVCVGSTLVSNRVDGPANFESWLASWDLFSVAIA